MPSEKQVYNALITLIDECDLHQNCGCCYLRNLCLGWICDLPRVELIKFLKLKPVIDLDVKENREDL